MPSRLSQDQRRMADLVAAVAADQSDLRIRHLALRPIDALELPRTFDDLQHALDVGFRELTAGSIAGERTVEAQRARPHELPALALLAKAVVLELREHHIREAIVDLRGVD